MKRPPEDSATALLATLRSLMDDDNVTATLDAIRRAYALVPHAPVIEGYDFGVNIGNIAMCPARRTYATAVASLGILAGDDGTANALQAFMRGALAGYGRSLVDRGATKESES